MDRKYFITTVIIGSIVVIVSIILVVFFNTNEPLQDTDSDSQILPTRYPIFQDKPLKESVKYNPVDQKSSLDTIENRAELSQQGTQIRAAILIDLGGTSGIVHTTTSFRLEYIKTPDTFMAEILTTDITQSKNDVNNYLTQKGFSQNDICNLPLVFYMSSQVAKSMQNSNTLFSPLPAGC